ncbi:MAG: caspase family protein [Pseudomonadota bacterium]
MFEPLRTACAAALICTLWAGAAMARDLALVIGNDSYDNVADLERARADARAYGAFFAERGFEVFLHEDVGGRDMLVALVSFYDEIRPGDRVVFVFAGHGWSDGVENYLVPRDIGVTGSPTLIAAESYPLRNGVNGVLDEIVRRGPSLVVAVIDACRDNPFDAARGTRSFGLERGLVPVEAPAGTFIAFSASAGQTALDRLTPTDAASNSVFSRVFLEELAKPQNLHAAFKETQRAVNALARTVGHTQRPAYYDEVIGDVCLTGACTPVSAAASVGVEAVPETPAPAFDVVREWQDFAMSQSVEALELFAERHEGSPYAALARERIAALAEPGPAPDLGGGEAGAETARSGGDETEAGPGDAGPAPEAQVAPQAALVPQPEPAPAPSIDAPPASIPAAEAPVAPPPPAPPSPAPAPPAAQSADGSEGGSEGETEVVRPDWCPRAATRTETAICGSDRLSALDVEMTRLYLAEVRRRSGADEQILRVAQRDWLRTRNACGRDAECLRATYERRIRALR